MCSKGCDEKISRRNFLTVAGASLAGATLSNGDFAQNKSDKATKALNFSNISSTSVNFDNAGAKIDGFLARPKNGKFFRAVVVTHGNAALPEDIRNTAAQLAQAGFVALAVNPTSRYPEMSKFPRESLRTNSFGMLMMSDIRAGMNYLKTLSFVKTANGFGLVGFCGGGIVALAMAALSREIAAVVALYAAPRVQPEQNSLDDPRPHLISLAEWIEIPVQNHYGTSDPYIPLDDAREFGQKLKKHNPRAETYFYEGAAHGFANYTNDTYDAKSAKLAENRMIKYFTKYLD